MPGNIEKNALERWIPDSVVAFIENEKIDLAHLKVALLQDKEEYWVCHHNHLALFQFLFPPETQIRLSQLVVVLCVFL